MKTLLSILILSASYLSTAQWNVSFQPGAQATPSAIEIVNNDTILVTTSNAAIIYRSTDGGQSWSNSSTMFEYSFIVDMHFPTALVGYASGGTYFGNYQTIIAKTIDGGETWDSLTSNAFPSAMFVNHIHFINADTGFIALDNSQILKTFNGGIDFISVILPNQYNLISDITFSNDSDGFLSASKQNPNGGLIYSILKTDDLGNTWSEVYTDTMIDPNINNFNNRQINKLFFLDSNHGYAAGGNGLFLKTNDAGQSWSSTFIQPFSVISAIHFTSIDTGYINLLGGIYTTENGGNDWYPQNIFPPAIINHINFSSASVGYAAANNRIYKTTNGGGVLNVVDYQSLNEEVSIFPNPTNNKFNLNLDYNTIKSISIYNIDGQLIMVHLTNFNDIDVSNLSQGIYSVVIETKEQKISEKLIKY